MGKLVFQVTPTSPANTRSSRGIANPSVGRLGRRRAARGCILHNLLVGRVDVEHGDASR